MLCPSFGFSPEFFWVIYAICCFWGFGFGDAVFQKKNEKRTNERIRILVYTPHINTTKPKVQPVPMVSEFYNARRHMNRAHTQQI